MTSTGWPGLGFDPAPGSPAGSGALARQLTDTARGLQETYAVLAGVRDHRGAWTGEAANGFADKLGQLPRYLDDAQQSLHRAGGVLRDWQGRLTELQGRARDLEAEARSARTGLSAAEDAERRARANPDFGLTGQTFSEADLPAAQRRVDAAQAGLDAATGTASHLRASLQELLRRAQVLSIEHESDAGRAAEAVRRADDGLAPPEPSWFEQAAGWVGDHLSEIGDVAGVVSGIAATLALIPVLTPFAGPIALVAGGVAVLAHGADMTVHDKWGDGAAWATLGSDAAGLIPLGGVVKEAGVGVRFSFQTVEGLAPMVSAGVEMGVKKIPEAIKKVGHAGALADLVAPHVTPMVNTVLPHLTGTVADPALVAKTMEGLARTGAQIPMVQSWLDPEHDHERAKLDAAVLTDGKSLSDLRFERFVGAAAKAAAR